MSAHLLLAARYTLREKEKEREREGGSKVTQGAVSMNYNVCAHVIVTEPHPCGEHYTVL